MSLPASGAAPAAAAPAEVRVQTRSEAETRDLAAALAACALPGDRVALLGPLGAGKTRFAQGFARGLGIGEPVTSPTFSLQHAYAGRIVLHHQDLYRCTDADDVEAAGLLDAGEAADAVTLVEWADRLGPTVGPDTIEIAIAPVPGGGRAIRLRAHGTRYAAWIACAAAWADAHRSPA